jgi:hypothetical protein
MKFSITTLIGVAKILAVFLLLGVWIAGLITWREAMTATVFAQTALSAAGFVRAQDSEDPKPPNV